MCVVNTLLGRRSQPAAFSYINKFQLHQLPLKPLSFDSSVLPAQKPDAPKRRRKPQKPGLTAKNQERHFVIHNYHDHAADQDYFAEHVQHQQLQQQKHQLTFPVKLHSVLDQIEREGLAHVVSWQPHGRAFVIHDPKEFVEHVMPRFFNQTKLTSFQRQLNLYGFCRLTRGSDAGGYYHELFLRGKTFLCLAMTRTKVKGTKFKAASSPEEEPDFYAMPPVRRVTPNTSDEEWLVEPQQQPLQSFGVEAPPVSSACPLEPLPIQHDTAPVVVAVRPGQEQQQASDCQGDTVLDNAVDEIFMNSTDESLIEDFLDDWDPNLLHLDDDTQLGLMLEQFLQD